MRNRTLKPIVFTLALVPLLRLAVLGLLGELGANPIEMITHQTGLRALTLLLVTLAITPLRRITGQLWLIQYRRMLGLFAFFYAVLHMLTYVWLDQFFNVHAMLKDIVKRPFITMGSAAFLMLVPLALTSTQSAIRRLGRRWQQLHRLVYCSAVAGVIHFLWLVKKDIRQPLIYALVLTALLGYRILAAVLKRYSSRQVPHAASQAAEKRAEATSEALPNV
ncbi:MAG: protein-methionine-sulfoxide reductase heme-binding subunit MsrQ [Candidatus Korobacteraceae bacterium]|jgi:sulfoxide reductase heme-binding subunit YedZ